MITNLFKKAERRQAKLKIAITGPSGSGKTFTSLRIATGLGGKIAVVDTENGSASLYADRFNFETLVLKPPYTIPKYLDAIKSAEAAGFDVLIIDSLSHAWAGDGGLLAKKEALDSRGGNSFSNWGGITKEHESFKSALLNCSVHLISTIRSKQDYVLEQNDKGKSAPRKVGLAPIQRDGMEYEFTTVFDMAMDHNASASKDRTGLFDGQIFKPTEETGEALMKWLNDAKPEEPTSSQIFCHLCNSELITHRATGNFICPNARLKDDGHKRVALSDLEFERAAQKEPPVMAMEPRGA